MWRRRNANILIKAEFTVSIISTNIRDSLTLSSLKVSTWLWWHQTLHRLKLSCSNLSETQLQRYVYAYGESNAAITHIYTLLSDTQFKVVYLLYLFRYWLPAGPSNTLSVHVLQNLELGEALWLRSGTPSLGWEVAEVTVSYPAKFHVSWFLQQSLSSHFLTVKLPLLQWVIKLS